MEHCRIAGWIVIVGLAGAIAKRLVPGRDPGGCLITIVIGIAGALMFSNQPFESGQPFAR